MTQPSHDDGLHAPGLRFGDPRVMALLAAIVAFAHVLAGFTNRELVSRMSALLDAPYHSRKATYNLRRLRRKGLIARIPETHRYQLTPLGRRVAVLFTKTHGRVRRQRRATSRASQSRKRDGLAGEAFRIARVTVTVA